MLRPRWPAFLSLSLLVVPGCGGVSEAGAPGAVGAMEPAPDFELTDLKGKTVTLREFRGKPVLLTFFGHG